MRLGVTAWPGEGGTDPDTAGRLPDRPTQTSGAQAAAHPSRSQFSPPTSLTLTFPRAGRRQDRGLCRARVGHQVAAWSSARRGRATSPEPPHPLPWRVQVPPASAVQLGKPSLEEPAHPTSPARRAGVGWLQDYCHTQTPASGAWDLEEMMPRTPGEGCAGHPEAPLDTAQTPAAHRSDVGSWQPSGCRSSTGAPLRSRRSAPCWPV